jgi:hypothetical protein
MTRNLSGVIARVAWLLLATLAGAGFAFLSLETLGVALVLLVPLFFLVRRSELDSPRPTIAFSAGYVVAIGYFAFFTEGFVSDGRVNWAGLAFMGCFECVGLATLLFGFVGLRIARTRLARTGYQGAG